MVHKSTNNSEMQGENDHEKKSGNKFFYQNKKQKANPWSSFEDEYNGASASNRGKEDFHSSGFKSSISSGYGPLSSNSKFDLDSVWSVRKNVPLPNKNQASQASLQTTKSFYSRHTGGISGSHQNKLEQKEANTDSSNTSWHMKRPGYSYTNQGSLKRQIHDNDNDANDDDEFDFSESKKENFQRDESPAARIGPTSHRTNAMSNKGAISNLINPIRKGSARTQRAHKMHEAYLKSAGLGFYAPKDNFRGNEEDGID